MFRDGDRGFETALIRSGFSFARGGKRRSAECVDRQL